MSSTPNPNRQRLMAPLDYLAAMSGYKAPEPPPVMPQLPFWQGPQLPMPYADPVPQVMPQPPQIPMEVLMARRRMGM